MSPRRRPPAAVLAGCLALALPLACSGPEPAPLGPTDGPGSIAVALDEQPGRVEVDASVELPRPDLRWEAGPAQLGSRRVALVVAADEFAESSWDLGFVRPAAERLRDVLVTDVGLDDDDVVLLTGDRVHPDLVRARLEQLTGSMQGPGNVLFIHWLGHGFNIDGRQQFLTHLSDGTPGGGYTNTLPYETVAAWAAQARRDVRQRGGELATAMVVDACRVDGLGAPSRLRDHEPAFDVEAFSAQVGSPVAGGDTTVPTFTRSLTDALAASWQPEVGLLDALRVAEREVLSEGRQVPDITTGARDVLLADRADLSVSVLAVDGITGQPLDGARVQLNGVELPAPASFDGLAPSPEGYDLRVLAEGYFWRSESVPFDETRSGQQVVVPLMPEFVAVTGSVSVTGGGAARVRLTGSFPGLIERDAYHRTTTTVGRGGDYWLPVPRAAGARALVVEVNGEEVRRRGFDLATAPSSVVEVDGTPVTVFDLGAQVVSAADRLAEVGGGAEARVIGGIDVAFDFDSLDRGDFTDNRGWSFYTTVRTFSDRGRYASARTDLDALLASAKVAPSGEAAIATLSRELAVAEAMDSASRAQRAGDLDGALDRLLASGVTDDPRVSSVLRSWLLASARERHAAFDFDGALARLGTLIEREPRNDDLRAQLQQVHEDWMETAFEEALHSGEWDEADRAAAQLGELPGASNADWLRRLSEERISPDCRANYQRGVTALADGDLETALEALESAVAEGSNVHYRGLIAPSLATIRDELFAKYNAIGAERLAADEPVAALRAYTEAWRHDRIVEHRIDALLEGEALDDAAPLLVANFRAKCATLAPVHEALEAGDAALARERFGPMIVLTLGVEPRDVRALKARIALLEDRTAPAVAAAAGAGSSDLIRRDFKGGGVDGPAAADPDAPSLRARWDVVARGLAELFERELWAGLDEAGVQDARRYIERQWPQVLQDEFEFGGARQHASGGESHWMLHYTHAETGLDYVLVPGGRFEMGDDNALSDVPAAPVRTVELDPFLICTTEMTQAAYEQLTGENPSTHSSIWGSGDKPVSDVGWDAARTALSALRQDLPTEAQWEYACRAGTTSTYSHGDSISKSQARYDTETLDDGPVDVASFAPNAFGLFDMHGNITEWVLDAPCSYQIDPRPGDGLRECLVDDEHVVRGGDYFFLGHTTASAARRSTNWSFQRIGFRAVRNLP